MEGIEALEILSRQTIPYSHKQGERVFGRIVFEMTFFTRDPHLPEGRERGIAVIDELRNEIPDSLYRWWWSQESKRSKPKRIGNHQLSATKDFCPDTTNQSFHFWQWDSEDWEYDAPAHSLRIYYESNWGPYTPIGLIHLTVPLDWLIQQQDGWALERFIQLCDRIQPRFGYAGLYLATPVDSGALQWNTQLAYPLLRRFPGINSAVPLGMLVPLSDYDQNKGCLPTVSWLTAVDEATLTLCGGEDMLRDAFGVPNFPVYITKNKVSVVQAGPNPQTGDLDAGILLPHYGHVSRFFRPIRVLDADKQYNKAYGSEGSNLDWRIMQANQAEWLMRFEKM